MVEYKTPGEIDAMHAAGQVVARVLAAVHERAAPGVRPAELDATARDVLAAARATAPFLGYQPAFADTPFPAVICAPVNDAALHDLPGRRRLRDGDLLSIDCGATLDGWTADAAISFQAGHPRPEDTRLIEAATQALRAGIAAAVPGGRLGDIAAAIGAVGHAARHGIPTDFGGHGIGHTMHEDPHIPNAGLPGRGPRLVPGLAVAIEPWFLAGGIDKREVDPNGRTVRSTDGSRAAHAEHTIAITDAGPVVLTAPA